jgi:hypothetical protein
MPFSFWSTYLPFNFVLRPMTTACLLSGDFFKLAPDRSPMPSARTGHEPFAPRLHAGFPFTDRIHRNCECRSKKAKIILTKSRNIPQHLPSLTFKGSFSRVTGKSWSGAGKFEPPQSTNICSLCFRQCFNLWWEMPYRIVAFLLWGVSWFTRNICGVQSQLQHLRAE